MKASELISKLQSLLAEHGDHEVLTWQEISWESVKNVRMVDSEELGTASPPGTTIFSIDWFQES